MRLGQQLVDKGLLLGWPCPCEVGSADQLCRVDQAYSALGLGLPICKMRDLDRTIPRPAALIMQGSDRVWQSVGEVGEWEGERKEGEVR